MGLYAASEEATSVIFLFKTLCLAPYLLATRHSPLTSAVSPHISTDVSRKDE